jgi:preprotein translocase subunit SecD
MRRSLTVSLIAIIVVAVAFFGGTLASGNTPKLGLDLQGGASVVLAPAKGAVVKPGTLSQAISIIRRRVNGLGVSEADVTQQGNNIIVELPGVKNQDQALSLVGQTAQLRFRPVLQTLPGSGTYDAATGTASTGASSATSTTVAPATSTTVAPTTTAPTSTVAPTTTKGALGSPSRARIAAAAVATQASSPTSSPPAPTATTAPATPPATSPTSIPPLTPRDQDNPSSTVVLPEVKPGTNEIVAEYVLGPTLLSGDAVSSADTQAPTGLGDGWVVLVHFTGKGSTAFDNIANQYYGQQIAIVLDGVVESAPTIQARQFNGTAQISGSSTAGGFTHRQASDLALVLRYGSLPVQLDQQTVQKVSATLGKDSLRAGLLAGIIGLVLVLLYMILYYRALGLVVVLGLMLSGALMYSIITYLGQTSFGLALSLAGATGIIVSVGVTVDSYIVYFERLKDEIRSGRTVRSSVDRGFSRAWRTIVSADAVSFIGAALLWLLTVGPVRGFAFFLGLSTLLDLLVAFTFTRPMVVLLGRNRTFTQARFFGVARGLAATPAGGA